MTYNYLNKHAETRTRIAQGARRQLYTFVNDNDKASHSAFRMNQIMLGKNGKVRLDRLRKGPSVVNDTFADNDVFSAYAYHTTSRRMRNHGDTERFDDEGLLVVMDAVKRQNQFIEVFITHHAILRAFERGLWLFKDQGPSQWVETFIQCAVENYHRSLFKMRQATPEKDTCIIEHNALNAVIQRAGRKAVILTFTPPTRKD